MITLADAWKLIRARLVALAAAVGCVLVAFGVRAFTGSPLASTGLVEQASGTVLYATAVFCGVVEMIST